MYCTDDGETVLTLRRKTKLSHQNAQEMDFSKGLLGINTAPTSLIFMVVFLTPSMHSELLGSTVNPCRNVQSTTRRRENEV